MQKTMSSDIRQIEIPRHDHFIEIEYEWINREASDAPLLIFLHEGLGCISMWRDWPQQACEQLRCRGLVYSRYGYGNSTPRHPDDIRTNEYLHQEARHDLPNLLKALHLQNERPYLYGHSDGGSIALLYAAMHPDRVSGIAVAAPHIFVEEITLDGIKKAREVYKTTELKARLGRHHLQPESVFMSWNDTWLKPEFKNWNIESYVKLIRCPILAIQGKDDEYGTLEQIYGIQRLASQAKTLVLTDCGHSPHRDQSEAVIAGLKKLFTQRGSRLGG